MWSLGNSNTIDKCEHRQQLALTHEHRSLPRWGLASPKHVFCSVQSFGSSFALFRTAKTLDWAGVFRGARMLCCKWPTKCH